LFEDKRPQLLPVRSAAGNPRYKVEGFPIGFPAISFMPKGAHFGDAELLRPNGTKFMVAVDKVPEEFVRD